MEFNGLPLHPLIVHAVVVLAPLTALAAVLASVWPAAQRKLSFLVPLGALVVLICTPIAIEAGEDLAQQFNNAPAVEAHGDLGKGVLWWAIGLFVTTAAQYLYLRRSTTTRPVRIVLAVLVVVASIGAVVQVALAGDAGAHLVWATG